MALIPPERLTDWTPGTRTGVPGGVAQYLPGGANERLTASFTNVTLPPYNADPTGVESSLAAIQQCITDNGFTYIPAGTYNVGGVITIDHQYDGMTLRGDGVDETILVGASFRFGTEDSGFGLGATKTLVTTPLNKDDTEVEVVDASFIAVGKLILISFDNETDDADIEAGEVPVVAVGGAIAGYGNRAQVSRVTDIVGNTLTIFPGIYHQPSGTPTYVRVAGTQIERVGFEDFTILDPGTTFPIYFVHAYGCWCLNVKVENLTNYGIAFGESLQCEIRRCQIFEGTGLGSNQAGFLIGQCAGFLVEDNILSNIFPCMEINAGVCGSVFGYNVCETLIDGGVSLAIDTNHNPHNSHNLYEGNILPNIMSDGYFGGESECTIYRNWIHGASLTNVTCGFSVALKRFSRTFSMCGNIYGKDDVCDAITSYGFPNLGNASFTGEAEPSAGIFWRDWKATGVLTTRTSDSEGIITLDSPATGLIGQFISYGWGEAGEFQTANITATASGDTVITVQRITGNDLPAVSTPMGMAMQPGGFQEKDLDVENTVVDKGNYAYGPSGVPGSMSSLGADTLTDSLYTTKADMVARGAIWGTLSFPPFAPTSPDVSDYESIPSGYRFVNNGADPGELTGGATFTVVNVTNFNIL
jgi:hypothetical protein